MVYVSVKEGKVAVSTSTVYRVFSWALQVVEEVGYLAWTM
jgi:hypothetical protein